MLLSGLLRTYNEQKNLARVLGNLFSFCDEVVISDGGSTDGTKFVAAHYRNIGYQVEWYDFPGGSVSDAVHFNHAGKQLNYGLERCSGDWIITQDADTIFCERTVNHLRETLQTTTHDAFIMYGVHLVGDKDHYASEFGTGPGLVQLFRNKEGVRFPDTPEHAHQLSDFPWKNLGVFQGGTYHFGYMDSNWEREKVILRAKAVPDDATYKHLLKYPSQHDPKPIPWERCGSDCKVCWMEEKAIGENLGILIAQRDEIVEMLEIARGNLLAALLMNKREEVERHTKVVADMEANLSTTEMRLKTLRGRAR